MSLEPQKPVGTPVCGQQKKKRKPMKTITTFTTQKHGKFRTRQDVDRALAARSG
jgi:hypothetical protein